MQTNSTRPAFTATVRMTIAVNPSIRKSIMGKSASHSYTKVKVDPCQDANGFYTVRFDDGTENGDTSANLLPRFTKCTMHN